MENKKIKMEIKKVLQRADGTKYVIIPRNSNIKKDDLIKLIKIESILD